MRLTIDTKEDSHEEIKHAIQILTNLLEKKGFSTPLAPEASLGEQVNMMDMFNSSPSAQTAFSQPATEETAVPMSMFANPEPKKEAPDTPPDFSSFLSLTKEMEVKKKDTPRVELF